MIEIPSIKAQYRVLNRGEKGIFLLSEFGHQILSGPLNEQVIPLIDGKLTTSQIADQLEGKLSREQVYYEILLLEKQGYILESDNSKPEGETAFWNYLGKSTAKIDELLITYPVKVISMGEIDTSQFEETLRRVGFNISEEAPFTVVLTDDYLHPELLAFNKKAHLEGNNWLPVKTTGGISWIGPLIQPGKSACMECLASRLRGNRRIEQYLEKEGDPNPYSISKVSIQSLEETIFNLVAIQLARLLSSGENRLIQNQLITFDQLGMETNSHAVVRRPQCLVCGDPESFRKKMEEEVQLSVNPRMITRDGGYRSMSPLVTFERLKHHVSPLTGIVEFLKPAQHDNSPDLHSYLAGHNFAMESIQSVHSLRQNIRSISGGKGSSEIQARTSALCEALERYSGIFQGEEPIVHQKAYQDMEGLAIHPNVCMQYSDLQYQDRILWNQKRSHFNVVPLPFEVDTPMDWVPIWSFTHKQVKYLPASYVYYNYSNPDDQFFCFADSNGNAAGNTREEAILQGFFELIERDAVCIWWYNRLRRPLVDLDSFQLPQVAILRERYRDIGREFWVLDLTFDFGIPVFVAITRFVNSPSEEIVFGFGAHFDAKIALSRALSEMNQFLPWAEKTRFTNGNFDTETSNWFRNARVVQQAYLLPLQAPPKKMWDYANLSHPSNIMEDVVLCQRMVEQKGMEFLVQDQTRPDVGLHVVKVIVPGLRHFWARFSPGRLYDVPFEMGLLPRKLLEQELNPISMFI